MRLTPKLLRLIGRVFNKDPAQFLALRLQYDGQMTWQVQDAVLTTSVVGGSGGALSVDLSQYTVLGLAAFLTAQPGYNVVYVDGSDNGALGAAVLLDASGDQNASNGDHLYGYTSVLWSFYEAMARELQAAKAQIDQMLLQMSTRTASDIWLDELGGYYGIPRDVGEPDNLYGPRIIAEVLRPRGNNVAIEMAIKVFTGQDTTVTDVVVDGPANPRFDGSYTFNGGWTFNPTPEPVYCLFDVEFGYDLINGGDVSVFLRTIESLINRLRDAGTHLRSLSLVGSALEDDAARPLDGTMTLGAHADWSESPAGGAPTEIMISRLHMAGLTDASMRPVDDSGLALNVTTDFRFNGIRTFNGALSFRGGLTTAETL
jgi:hypothetical protein